MRYPSPSHRCAVMLMGILAAACASPKGANVGEKTAEVRRMRDETLRELYRQEPEVRSRLERAAGYAVFSNRGSQLLLSTGSGFGVAVENRTGRETFMRMAEVGVGLGLGIKDFRTIFLFHDAPTLRKFVNDGWEFGSEADAAAKVGEHGSQISGAGAAGSTIEVYQFTENGLALRAAVSGTRYWKDDELNTRG